MDQSLYENSGGSAIAEPNNARLDHRQHEIVEHGILLQLNGNTVSAFEFLRGRDVDPQVIRRVLLEPHRRRGGN
jgi:hypothetical protein